MEFPAAVTAKPLTDFQVWLLKGTASISSISVSWLLLSRIAPDVIQRGPVPSAPIRTLGGTAELDRTSFAIDRASTVA
jgi:hypothetical protein